MVRTRTVCERNRQSAIKEKPVVRGIVSKLIPREQSLSVFLITAVYSRAQKQSGESASATIPLNILIDTIVYVDTTFMAINRHVPRKRDKRSFQGPIVDRARLDRNPEIMLINPLSVSASATDKAELSRAYRARLERHQGDHAMPCADIGLFASKCAG